MADSEALSKRLNKASKRIHSISNSLVNAKLIALLTDKELYAKALSRFYYVFAALEQALDEALKNGDSDVEKFKTFYHQKAMYRTAGFRADLEYLLGPNWEACCGSKSPPLKEYEHHLSLLAATKPRLLLAHSYTQHLAMAAGGQVIRRLVRKHLALTEEDAGTDAFEFKGESSNTLRTKFKATLDEWARGLPEEDVRQLISEHVTTFQFQNAIIRAFPIPTAAVVKGVLQLIPRPLLLAVLAVLAAALVLLVAPTVPWVAAAMGWQVLPDAAP